MTNDERALLARLVAKWRNEAVELDSYQLRQYWDPAVTALVSCAIELERTMTTCTIDEETV